MIAVAQDVIRHDKFFIGGEWVSPSSSSVIDVVGPHNGELAGQVPEGSVADIDAAIAAAREAFDSGPWSKMAPAERAEVLDRFATALESRAAELAEIGTLQGGNLLVSHQKVNVPWGINVLRHYATMIRDTDFAAPRACSSANADVRRLPLGVVAAIVPWNIALIGALSKIAPALAAGCTVIHKPSPETPLDAYLVAEAAAEAGFPAGVFNLVPADREASERLVTHPDVDQISFTGSTPVGKHIASLCAAQMKRCSMELGGNAALIVLDDIPMEAVIPGILGTSVKLNNGEACIAQTRILVPKSQYEAYAAALGAAASRLVVGDPSDPQTHVGPMVTEKHLQRVQDYIRIGQEEGARLVSGGNRPENLRGGWYIQPAVFADVTNDMRICQEEIFGPVIKIIPYESDEEAIAIANDQPFGLSSSVWGVDAERAVSVARQIIAGSVFVNGAMTIDANVPFGGFKQSGLGRECGPEGLDEYLEQQVIFTPKASQ